MARRDIACIGDFLGDLCRVQRKESFKTLPRFPHVTVILSEACKLFNRLSRYCLCNSVFARKGMIW